METIKFKVYNFVQYVLFEKKYRQCTMGSAPETGEVSRIFV